MRYIKVILIAVVLLLTHCDSQHASFNRAREENTIQALESFLEKYPQGEYTGQAKALLEQLEFNKAQSVNSFEAYEMYLTKYPDGRYLKRETSIDRLITLMQIEDIQLLNDYLKTAPASDLKSHAELILLGQSVLQSGSLERIELPIPTHSASSYAKELTEIIMAIRSSSSPHIMKEAANLYSKGDIFKLFPVLIKIQSIVDNRLMRHTIGQFLVEGSKKFHIPQTVSGMSALGVCRI